MEDKFRYFDWVVAGICALAPLLMLWWSWRLTRPRPELAAEKVGVAYLVIRVLLLGVLAVFTVLVLVWFGSFFWRDFNPG